MKVRETNTETIGLSVVIPAYNESEAIQETLKTVVGTLESLPNEYEVIVVDDGSSDDTSVKIVEAGVRVIRHPINSGYGRSLITGIEHASYENIVIVDADGTYPFADLPALLEMYCEGFDMVVGARTGEHYRESLKKWVLRIIFRMLAEFTCGRTIPDINSGFRIINREKTLKFKRSYSSGFSFTTTITLLFMLNHLFVGYKEISYAKRKGISKVKIVKDGLRSLQIIVTAIAQYNPLKLYLLLVSILLCGNIGIGILWQLLEIAWTSIVFVFFIWNHLNIVAAISIISVILIKPRENK